MKKLWENLSGTRKEQIESSVYETYNGACDGVFESSSDLVEEFENVLKNQDIEYDKSDLEFALEIAEKIMNLENKTWGEVKHIYSNRLHVDKDNVEKTGECIVDIQGTSYAVIGTLVDNDSETVIEIDDNALIYKTN